MPSVAASLYRNPRLLLLLLGLIAVVGLASLSTLPRMEDPILTQRFGVIRTILPGATAERVESQITRTIEDQLSSLSGIKEIESSSRPGISTVGLELEEDVSDVDIVWSKVRDELTEVAKLLPEDAGAPIFHQPELKAFAAIVALKWTAPGEPSSPILGRLALDLESALRSLPGTESVSLYGEPDEEILVELPPEVLRRTGLTVGAVSSQIRQSETKFSGGMMRGPRSELGIEVAGDFDSLKRLGATPIRYGAEGRLVDLAELATITRGAKDPPASVAIVDGLDSVVAAVFVRNEYRIDQWSRRLDGVLDDFRASLPAGIELEVIFNQNEYVGERLAQLAANLLTGTAAVTFVVFLLMGWRSMIVVGVTLPLTAMIVFSGMRFMGIPVHQMSVTGLIIALGLLIDNAIVMVDEVRSGVRDGKSPLDAISHAVGHLGLPLFGSTFTTTLAFIPIATLPGASGEFVGSIGVSVILAINGSLLLSMTVAPALIALLQPKSGAGDPSATEAQGGFWRYGASCPPLARLYRRSLAGVYRMPVLGVLLGFALPLVGFHQVKKLPEQFFPPADRKQAHIELDLPASSSIAETRAFAMELRDAALAHGGIARVHWFVGGSAPSFFYNLLPRRKHTPSYAQALVELSDPKASRETIRSLQDLFDREFPRGRILVRQLEQGPPFDAPVELRLSGPDLAVLQELGEEIRLLMTRTDEVVQARAALSDTSPKIVLKIDEHAARLAGMSHAEIGRQLYAALEGIESGKLVDGPEEVPIRVKLAGERGSSVETLSTLELAPPPEPGAPPGPPRGFPLSALAELVLEADVATIPRIEGSRINEIKAYLTAGTLPATVLEKVRRGLEETGFSLPPGYALEFAGEAAKRDEAVGNLMADIGILIALMVVTLVTSFRSFRAAFVIATVGGLSIGAGLGSLWLFGYPFGFMGIVGTMGLVGLALNDAIVVMAGIREDPEARAGSVEAIVRVVEHRTRHIVATTFTTVAGFLPLILGGGGFWPPVAAAIAGGVSAATLLALYFVPSLYLIFQGRPAHGPATAEVPAPASPPSPPRSPSPSPSLSPSPSPSLSPSPSRSTSRPSARRRGSSRKRR